MALFEQLKNIKNSLLERFKNAKDPGQNCDNEIYKNGKTIFVLGSCRSKTIEEWVKVLRERSGERVDWFTIGGRSCIRVLPYSSYSIKAVRKAIQETLPELKYYYETIEGPEQFPNLSDMDYPLNACWYDDEFMMIPACVPNKTLYYRLKDAGIENVPEEVMDTWSSFERGRVCDWASAVYLLKTNKYQKVPSTPKVIIPYVRHLNIPEEGQHKRKTFKTEISETEYLVQANHNETHSFWQRFALQAKSMCATSRELAEPDKYVRFEWEQGCGMCEQIGTLDNRPVMISVFWNKLNGHRIGFWEMDSQVCDYKMAEEWLTKTFKDVPRTDSSNFHHALRVIENENS